MTTICEDRASATELLIILVSLCSLALREHNLTEWAGRIFKADSQKFSVGVNSLRVISRQAGRDFKVDSPKFSSRVVDIIFIKIYRPINVLPAELWNYRNAMTLPRYELFLKVFKTMTWQTDRYTDWQIHRWTEVVSVVSGGENGGHEMRTSHGRIFILNRDPLDHWYQTAWKAKD